MEDFNVDSGEWFPNQAIDGDPTECVAITVTDIIGDKLNVNLDPDFTYAMTLRLQGEPPGTSGSDPWSGMLSAIAYGLLPMSDADFTSLVKGELYTSNWQNYSPQDRQTALKYVQNDCFNLPLDFNGVIQQAKMNYGAGLAMLWYGGSFNRTNPDGTLPSIFEGFSRHMVRVVGQKTVNGTPYMLIKPWLGKNYGLGGYALLSKQQFILCAIGAYTFDPHATSFDRWLSLIGIATTKTPYLLDLVPALIKAPFSRPLV